MQTPNILRAIKDTILEKKVLYFVVLTALAGTTLVIAFGMNNWFLFTGTLIIYLILLWIGAGLQMMREKGVI